MWIPYDELYEVSVQGQVRNMKTGLVLKPYVCKRKGYHRVSHHKYHLMAVHRLVASCFLPRVIMDDHQVHHINHDPSDNRAENLMWVSNQQNTRFNEHTNIVMYLGKYRVRFRKDKVNIFLKSFDTLEEAIQARDTFKSSEDFRLSL
jgi:hypothetical protein